MVTTGVCPAFLPGAWALTRAPPAAAGMGGGWGTTAKRLFRSQHKPRSRTRTSGLFSPTAQDQRLDGPRQPFLTVTDRLPPRGPGKAQQRRTSQERGASGQQRCSPHARAKPTGWTRTTQKRPQGTPGAPRQSTNHPQEGGCPTHRARPSTPPGLRKHPPQLSRHAAGCTAELAGKPRRAANSRDSGAAVGGGGSRQRGLGDRPWAMGPYEVSSRS